MLLNTTLDDKTSVLALHTLSPSLPYILCCQKCCFLYFCTLLNIYFKGQNWSKVNKIIILTEEAGVVGGPSQQCCTCIVLVTAYRHGLSFYSMERDSDEHEPGLMLLGSIVASHANTVTVLGYEHMHMQEVRQDFTFSCLTHERGVLYSFSI